ncbi:MAG: hypothetical protein JJ921_15070 [Pseudomonadales bacterium]|nr:hypothetical protein [Pseudomonadales bacterium]MBO7004283.1 hypothetical protein [Pseudomonadales bacterium]
MESESYRPEQTEQYLRSRLLVISGLVMAPMFLWFATQEIHLQHWDMTALTLVGAMLCIGNVWMGQHCGLNKTILRISLVYLFFVALYYVNTAFTTSSLLFCVILPFTTSFMLGYREAFVWNLFLGAASLFLIFSAEPFSKNTFGGYATDFVAAYVLAICVSLGYERMWEETQRRAIEEHQRLLQVIDHKNDIAERNEQLFEDLNNALREVRELTGLIPICSTCKKIRSDDDFWEHVEAYLHKRTQLTFSHSMCPSCANDAIEQLEKDLRS